MRVCKSRWRWGWGWLWLWLWLRGAAAWRGVAGWRAPVGVRSVTATRTASCDDWSCLPSWLADSCLRMGYKQPTVVQQSALGKIFDGNDVVLQAQTGSGKTLVFALPLLAQIDASHAAIQAIIVAPTKELVQQIGSTMKMLSRGAPNKISVMLVMEGSLNRRQQLWATAEPPHIVVGSPQALLRLVETGRLRLRGVRFVVIDEVDACMLRIESKSDLHQLLSKHLSRSYLDATAVEDPAALRGRPGAPSRRPEPLRLPRQTIMCSATIPQRNHFTDACRRNGWTEAAPTLLNLSHLRLVPEAIAHERCDCDRSLRPSAAAFLVREFLSADAAGQCVVFADDCMDACAQVLGTMLRTHFGDQHGALMAVLRGGEEGREQPREALSAFREGRSRVLLCSDLAARGIDLPGTALVLQMALPGSATDYLHRAGRTGRLERAGKSVVFTSPEENFVIQRFQNELGVTFGRRDLRPKTAAPLG